MEAKIFRILIVALLIFVITITAQVPRLIDYQGKLTNTSGVALNGDYDITFNIYDVETGGTALWSEPHTGVNDVTVTKGLFDVKLGSITTLSLLFDEQYWLELTIEGESLTPREKLAAVPYALNSDLLDGHDASYFATAASSSDDQTLSYNSVTDEITIEDGNTIDISEVNTDDQNISGSGLAGTILTIDIENGTGETVDLASLVDDADCVIGNEYNTGATWTDGTNTFTVTDGGGDVSAIITGFMDSGADNWVDEDGDAMTGQLDMTGYTGAPFVLDAANAVMVANLNADMVDGQHWSDMQAWVNANDDVDDADCVIGNEVTNATNTTLTRSGSGTSGAPWTLALNLGNANTWTGMQTFNQVSGTKPFTVTTAYATGATVTNLSADLLDGHHASYFMTAASDNWVDETGDAMTGQLDMTGYTGAPFVLDAGNAVMVANLNADMVDGQHWSDMQAWVNANDDVDDADCVIGNEYNTGATWTDGTNTFTVTDGGGDVSAIITGFMDSGADNWVDETGDAMTGQLDMTGYTGAPFVLDAGNAVTVTNLDADLLDGQHGAYYLDWDNFTDIPAGFADGVDNVDDADCVIGNEYQNLGFTNAGSGYSYFEHTVTITNGTNATTRDYYNADNAPAATTRGEPTLNEIDARVTALSDNYSSWTARDDDGTSYTVTSADVLTFDEGTGIDVNFTADDVLTFTHKDMSSQGSVDNSGGTVIQDVTMGALGHVTGLTSVNLDGRYLNESSNLSDLDNTATARSNLGLVAGGAGDIWVEKAGDAMTGFLTLHADPTSNMHAVTKQYVDDNIGGGIGGGTSGQTLRHNGTSWVANSILYNNGTNVGIGITTPSAKLHVKGANGSGSSAAPDAVTIVGGKGGEDAAGGEINITAGQGGDMGGGTGGPGGDVNITAGTGNTAASGGNVYIDGGAPDAGSAGHVILASNNGYVGINTTPTNPLDINGQIRIRGGSPGSGKILQSNATGVGSWVTPGSISDGDWTVSGSDMYSAVSGNVGIGTSSPGAKMDISYNAGATTSDVYGVRSQITQQDVNQSTYAGYFKSTLDFNMLAGVQSLYGVYAEGQGESSIGTVYGIYAKASGGATNYAGYFNGNTAIDGSIYLNSNSGTSGQVLTSSGSGDAYWSTIESEINGSGEANYITKWLTSDEITRSSLIYELAGTPGSVVFSDSFKTSTLGASWTSDGFATSSGTYHSSPYSCRGKVSGTESVRDVDSIYTTKTLSSDGYISFWYKTNVTGCQKPGNFSFFIDGEQKVSANTTKDWTYVNVPCNAGSHKFKWKISSLISMERLRPSEIMDLPYSEMTLWFDDVLIAVSATNSGIGIGTTSPTEKLHVVGNIALSGANRFIGTTDNYALSLRTNDNDRVYITNGGNVGIGTTSPSSALSVGGAGNALYEGYFYQSSTTSGATGVYAKAATPTSGGNYAYGVRGQVDSGNGWTLGVHGSASGGSGGGRAYGVRGYANGGTTRYNYGVYGYIGGSYQGAGVVGYDAIDHSGWSGQLPSGNWAGYFHGDVYIYDNCSAQSFTDRTPYPKDKETAYSAVISMNRLPDGVYDEEDIGSQLDHESLDPFVKWESESGDGRNLSATVSAQNVVIKDLIDRIESLEVQRITPKTSSVSEFGREDMSSDEMWVHFSRSFSESIPEDEIPVVTVTPNCPSVVLCITETSRYGFRVVGTSGETDGFSFNWIAIANAKPENSSAENGNIENPMPDSKTRESIEH